MKNNKSFTDCGDCLKNCTRRMMKKAACISMEKSCEIKRLAKLMICLGIVSILVLCFPPTVWFIVLAIGMIIIGIKILASR